MSQESIILFSGVEILPKLTKTHVIEYLKRYCTIDDLGDSIYVKKLGNDQTTFAIDFFFDQISQIRKIKDKQGNNLDENIFHDHDLDDPDYDDEDYDDVAETDHGVNS